MAHNPPDALTETRLAVPEPPVSLHTPDLFVIMSDRETVLPLSTFQRARAAILQWIDSDYSSVSPETNAAITGFLRPPSR